jgi:hypothetical protein
MCTALLQLQILRVLGKHAQTPVLALAKVASESKCLESKIITPFFVVKQVDGVLHQCVEAM